MGWIKRVSNWFLNGWTIVTGFGGVAVLTFWRDIVKASWWVQALWALWAVAVVGVLVRHRKRIWEWAKHPVRETQTVIMGPSLVANAGQIGQVTTRDSFVFTGGPSVFPPVAPMPRTPSTVAVLGELKARLEELSSQILLADSQLGTRFIDSHGSAWHLARRLEDLRREQARQIYNEQFAGPVLARTQEAHERGYQDRTLERDLHNPSGWMVDIGIRLRALAESIDPERQGIDATPAPPPLIPPED